MKFRTEVDLPKYNFNISYDSYCLFLGSCFANNIGNKLFENKLPISINPSGILYNPLSIANCLSNSIDNRMPDKSDLFLDSGIWKHFDFHSFLSCSDQERTYSSLCNSITSTKLAILKSDILFVSFGTAFCYFLKDTDVVVSNCHKQTSDKFSRKLLTVNDIINEWQLLISLLHKHNPKLKIVFTISPIRHWKDGATQNQISKSVLFLAIDEIINSCLDCFYFPSYEIVNDELRDYRFYDNDMFHPSEIAIDYIWEKFKLAFFDEKAISINQKVEKIITATKHRAFNEKSVEHRQFASSFLAKIDELERRYTNIDLKIEKEYFQNIIDL